MEVKLMTIHQTMLLLAGTCLLGGCTATITPRGEIYTEAYLPAETVVVESYTTPVVVPVAAPRPLGPLASAPRPHSSGPRLHTATPRPGSQPQTGIHRPSERQQGDPDRGTGSARRYRYSREV